MLHQVLAFAIFAEFGSIATSTVDGTVPTLASSEEAPRHCTVSWANLDDPRSVTVEAFVDELKTVEPPVLGQNMKVARIRSIEYTSETGAVERTSGSEVEDLLDSDMLRALEGKSLPDYPDNKALCEGLLRDFGEYMYRTSERYQHDARSLGIMPGSNSFVAWSILNLKLERAYNHYSTETSPPELGCDIKEGVCVDERPRSGFPGHSYFRVSLSAGSIPPTNNVAIKSFTVKGKKEPESDEGMVCRLNRDLQTMPHYVTTENAPDLGNSEETCESFFQFKAWELDQMLSHIPRVKFCLKDDHSGDSEVPLAFLRWRNFDIMRQNSGQKRLRKAEKSGCVVS
ncbi:hypothetical protein FOZ60_002751 [Perkinsus olseni]|uniref:Uncharacterized protein n=1 Tax=Perkinsus olseni TaxID=32597 RepID=A0A7J6NZJ6_PEROL|nr:hypothetical protein FOZ60_002751 [Perkinsus olseni]